MANRTFTQFRGHLEKAPVSIFIALDGAGAANPVLLNGSLTTAGTGGYKGVKSVTRNGVGDYTITLQDTYQKVLSAKFCVFSRTAAAPAISNAYIKSAATTTAGGGTVTIVTFGATMATPVEMGATVDRLLIELVLSNSNAP